MMPALISNIQGKDTLLKSCIYIKWHIPNLFGNIGSSISENTISSTKKPKTNSQEKDW
jgi:hypothetical protein